MSTFLKTGLIQQHNTKNTEDNRNRVAASVRKLAKKGAQLIVLQELHDTLYFCQEENVNNFDLAQSIPGLSTTFYSKLAKECSIVLVTSLFEHRMTGIYHNTAVVFEKNGCIAGKYRKMHIPDDPAYYEKFYFTPGDLGFNPIQTSIGRLGVLVCWDQWYPEAARIMALKGAEILIYPTAIGFDQNDTVEEQKRQKEAWITIQRGNAIANGLPVITVNRVGFEEANYSCNGDIGSKQSTPNTKVKGIPFWGNSFVAGPQGEILAQASDKKEQNLLVEIDMKRSENVRRWWPFLRDRRIEEYSDIIKRCAD